MPFNIASYSLLTYMIAHVTGLKPVEFVHTLGDAHIYSNHLEVLKEQVCGKTFKIKNTREKLILRKVERKPRPFPKLTIKRKIDDIDDFIFDDFVLSGYDPHASLKMSMAL